MDTSIVESGVMNISKPIVISRCKESDFDTVLEIINDGARAYKGVIPEDRWHEPYMPKEEFDQQVEQGVEFWGVIESDNLAGVMGIQDVGDVALIRHAYVRTVNQGKGIGSMLLDALTAKSSKPFLVGTWADAAWAIRFYEKHGFRLVSKTDIPRLLEKYWSIPARQIETSVVLADGKWFDIDAACITPAANDASPEQADKRIP